MNPCCPGGLQAAIYIAEYETIRRGEIIKQGIAICARQYHEQQKAGYPKGHPAHGQERKRIRE